MRTLDDYPAACRQSIQTIAERLETNYETAYALMCLQAVLWDFNPSDKEVEERILAGREKA